MSQLLGAMLGQLQGGPVDQISERLGVDRETASAAVSTALPILLKALARNANEDPKEAESLAGALERDHDGSILSHVTDFFQKKEAPEEGNSILKHVLGDRQSLVVAAVSKAAGLSKGNSAEITALLAPVVLGQLGKVKQEEGLDASGLASLLSGEEKSLADQIPEAIQMMNRLLDRDGDGSAVDELADMGGALLGRLFR